MPYQPPIQQDQYPATSETQCLQVIIPDGDEFKALLSGLIATAADVNSYADPDSAQAEGLAAQWDEAINQINWDGCPVIEGMPQIDLFSVNATPLAGIGTLTYNSNTGLPFGYAISTQNITLYGMEQPVWLRAGEYSYVGWASLTTGGGNTSVAITDGTSVIDTIITSVNQNGTFGTRVKHTGTFTIPDDGLYKMVVGNVTISAGYVVNWISHHIRRTGD